MIILFEVLAEPGDFVIYALRKAGIDSIVASISSRNVESLDFHKKHGLVERGRLEAVGRKFGKDFDVVWMQKHLS